MQKTASSSLHRRAAASFCHLLELNGEHASFILFSFFSLMPARSRSLGRRLHPRVFFFFPQSWRDGGAGEVLVNKR